MQTSFCYTAKTELASIALKKPCCRRAMLYGLLYASAAVESEIRTSFSHDGVAALFETLVGEVYGKQTKAEKNTVVGRETWCHSFVSKRIAAYLVTLDAEAPVRLAELAGFKCGGCRQAFLRGVFLAVGTMTDPSKSFHAEMMMSRPERAEKLDDFLALCGIPARRLDRGARIGLYYKNSTAIEELFAEMGANSLVFELMNIKIEKNIRNQENRATNCVARNISRSVDAIHRQVCAIEKLRERGMLDSLPEDLRVTAELRLKLDEASLSELAVSHTPPISKSGLNHRLARLVELSEKIK